MRRPFVNHVGVSLGKVSEYLSRVLYASEAIEKLTLLVSAQASPENVVPKSMETMIRRESDIVMVQKFRYSNKENKML